MASTAPGMSGVNPGIAILNVRLQNYFWYAARRMFVRLQKYLARAAEATVIRESRRAPWLAVGVVCFCAFMGLLPRALDHGPGGGLVSMARDHARHLPDGAGSAPG
jgi:hypothetical protein